MNQPLTKPYESTNGDNTVDYFSYIDTLMETQIGNCEMNSQMETQNEKRYHATYVIGVSFGANISKWRNILKAVFHHNDNEKYPYFNDVKEFGHALLITDPVYVEDNNEICKSLSNNLQIKLRGTSRSYLHTKFILIRMENEEKEYKYILFVSSKNISNSNNFDILVPLFSKKVDEQAPKVRSGIKMKKYLEFLLREDSENKESENENLKNCLDGLEKIEFDVENSDGDFPARVTDFEISYNGIRFSDDLWAEIKKCDRIISPYISEKKLQEVLEDKSDKDKSNIRIISYQQTWNKLQSDKPVGNLTKLTGAPAGEQGGRYKFHAKLYMTKTEEGKTKLYFGSANLTDEAWGTHYEMMIGIEFDDEDKSDNQSVYDYINVI